MINGYRYVLDDNIEKDSLQTVYTFSNFDGKTWSIPCRDTNVGLEIYEPSGKKGIVLKKCNYLLSLYVVRKVCKINKEIICLDRVVSDILKKYWGNGFLYSIFYGTPSTDQKTTIQVYKDKNILGYCKVGLTDRVGKLFEKESTMLQYLNNRKVLHVPKTLFVGNIGGYYLFLQTTEKQVGSSSAHYFNSLHTSILDDIKLKTHEKIEFIRTDLYNEIAYVSNKASLLNTTVETAINKSFKDILMYYKDQFVDWGVVHGDFTPWNTCIINENIFAFDFEYSLKNGPSSIDYWHFMIQCLIYEKRYTKDRIKDFIIYNSAIDINRTENYLELQLYFLFIISIYLKRGKKEDLEIANFRGEILADVLQTLGE